MEITDMALEFQAQLRDEKARYEVMARADAQREARVRRYLIEGRIRYLTPSQANDQARADADALAQWETDGGA